MKAILAEPYKSSEKAKITRDVNVIKSEFTNIATVTSGDNDNANAK
jgi:hypothetical protein